MKSEQKKAERILGLFSSGLSAVATFYFTDIGLHMRSIFLFWASASGWRIGLYIQTISSSFFFHWTTYKTHIAQGVSSIGLIKSPIPHLRSP